MLITRRFLSEELMLRREIIHLSFGEAEHAGEKPFALLLDNKIQFGNYQGALDIALDLMGCMIIVLKLILTSFRRDDSGLAQHKFISSFRSPT